MIVKGSSSFKMELPFELSKSHKAITKWNWKNRGLITDEFEEIYQQYIYSSNCELCGNEYKSRNDRQMEHCHETGKFRNICCRSCNQKKRDAKIKSHSKSGHKYIHKEIRTDSNQGFTWKFRVTINGKHKTIKKSVNLEKLIKFRDEWLEKNEYYK